MISSWFLLTFLQTHGIFWDLKYLKCGDFWTPGHGPIGLSKRWLGRGSLWRWHLANRPIETNAINNKKQQISYGKSTSFVRSNQFFSIVVKKVAFDEGNDLRSMAISNYLGFMLQFLETFPPTCVVVAGSPFIMEPYQANTSSANDSSAPSTLGTSHQHHGGVGAHSLLFKLVSSCFNGFFAFGCFRK